MNLLEVGKDFSDLTRTRTWRWTFVAALFTPLIVAALAFSLGWDASYSVSAQTQYLEFSHIEPSQPKWAVAGVGVEGANHREEMFTGAISLPPFSRVLAERIGTGETLLTILPPEQKSQQTEMALENEAAGTLTRVQLPALVAIPGCTQDTPQAVLPITGSLVLGREVGDQAAAGSPVLLSGSVRVLGRELFSSNRFEAARGELDPGDRLAFEHDAPNNQLGAGFIQLTCVPEISVVYHTPAKAANVSRFGAVGYKIKPSIWSRLVSDTFFQIAFIMYSSIAPFLFMGTLAVYRLRKSARP